MLRLAIVLFLAGAAQAEPLEPEVEDLKRLYLGCESRAQAVRPEVAEVAECSRIYEDLKRRGFGGEFRRLHKWYKREISAEHSVAA